MISIVVEMSRNGIMVCGSRESLQEHADPLD